MKFERIIPGETSHIRMNSYLSDNASLERKYEKLSVSQTFEHVSAIEPSTPIFEGCIRFVCVSDTHSAVENKPHLFPPGDILLHAGDFTMVGTPEQIDKFNTFLQTLDYAVKVVIAGNHDMSLDDDLVNNQRDYIERQFRITKTKLEDYLLAKGVSSSKELLKNCIFLQDLSVTICGINIFGSSWVPSYCGMGFNVDRGRPLMEKWNLIPQNTDILLTHGPPLGRGDLCITNRRAGCFDLLNTVQQRVKPRYHVFGHIHEGHGSTTDGTTVFINAAMCSLRYKPEYPVFVFDYPIPAGHTKDELFNISLKNNQPT